MARRYLPSAISMTDTLSTVSSEKTDKLVPVDTDKEPIVWDNNRATIEGVLDEVHKFHLRCADGPVRGPRRASRGTFSKFGLWHSPPCGECHRHKSLSENVRRSRATVHTSLRDARASEASTLLHELSDLGMKLATRLQ